MKLKELKKKKEKTVDLDADCLEYFAHFIKVDPSGRNLSRLLALLFQRNLITKEQQAFYYYEAERAVYGVNMHNYYEVH